MRKIIKIGRVHWSYLDSEKGDEVWLGFHGFGQGAEVVNHFLKTLRPDARILSFDLPLHGETFVEKGFIKPGELAELLGKALIETDVKSCNLFGFSLGGKVVLKMVELAPGKIDRVVLIAPDGLKVNPFYGFATNTVIGRLLFKLIIRFPQPFLGTSWILAKSRLMNPKIHDFVTSQMGNKEKRQKVYDTWQIFKKTVPNLDDVRKKIWRYRMKLTLVFGINDRVIHPKLAKKLSGDNCKSASVIMLNAGHHLLTKKHAEVLKDQIQ